MDVNDIVNALNGLLDLGDTLDNSGVGVRAMTDGEHTTREVCKLELGAFLLYVGDGAAFYTDGQGGLVNLLLSDQYGQIPTWRLKSVAAELSAPDANKSMSYMAFEAGDRALALQNHTPVKTQCRDLLITIYESFGGLMVAFNENAVSRMRYNNYLSALKARLNSGGTGVSASSVASSAPEPEVDISEYIPAGVPLTDIQKDYLTGVVRTMKRWNRDHVTKAEIAMVMKKETSAVSSGIQPLIKKGILDINDDAEVVIAEKKAEAPKPAVKPAAKKTGKSKPAAKKAEAGGQLVKYNDRISFALSRDYQMIREKDDDGEEKCKIESVKKPGDDEDSPSTTFFVSIMKNDNPDKELFDIVQDGDDKSTFVPFNSDPEALLSITYLDMQILSMNFRTSLYRLFIRLSQEESLQLFLTSTSSQGENKLLEDMTKMFDMWRCIRLDGEKVDLGEANSINDFAVYLTELQDNGGKPKKKKAAAKKISAGAKTKQKEKAIIRTKPAKYPDAEQYTGIHEVEDEPETITPAGTWSIQVPPGCSYTMDPDCAGGGFTGKYLLQIQSTEDRNFDNAYDSRISLAVFSNGVKLKGCSALIDLSADEAADEIAGQISEADDEYTFYKRTAGIAIMTKTVNDSKNEYGLMFLVIARGNQFAVNGQVVVRGKTNAKAREDAEALLNSIAAVNPSVGDDGYVPVIIGEKYHLTYHEHNTLELGDGIILPVPDGYKGSTDQDKIGAPRVFSIVPKDYKDFSKAMDAVIGITAVSIQGQVPEYTPAICEKVTGLITEQFEQQGIFLANVGLVVAQKSTDGIVFYQKTYGLDTNMYLTAKGILWAGKTGLIVSFAVNLDEKIASRSDVGMDVQQIISGWMNRIQLPGEKLFFVPSEEEEEEPDQISSLISPAPQDLLHEHFDLVESGQYTTRRSADFRGQSIRGLMEKCGTESEDAYDLMKIDGDTYKLDKDAEILAKVFRLNEDLFDPYEDTEAMIRIGMFSDVRMYHALRSLAWMTNRYCSLARQKMAGITFDELQRMGEVIERRNYLNYDGKSVCEDLCYQYDWHVFYVPDSYLSSDEKDDTDLRYLTGKENRGGNSVSIFMPGLGGLGNMNRVNDLIGRNEETLASLEGLRKDLEDMLPVMRTIHDGLLEGRDRSEELEGPLADALTAWCALAIAAKEPFYSEEAADTPEADAGLDEPLERPDDKLDDKPVSGGKPAAKKPAASKKPAAKKAEKTKQPAGEGPASSGTGKADNADILALDKYKGVHHVTGKAERISPFGSWSIEVPPSFSYAMDPSYTSKTATSAWSGNSEGRDHYPLQIQTTKDCDFSNAYGPSFGLAIQEQKVNFIKVSDDWTDLKSEAARDALAEIEKNSLIRFKVLKHTKDILIQYDDSNRDDEALTIGFTIFCSGSNYGVLGQVDIHGDNRDDLEAAAMAMLKSVEKMEYDYSLDVYMPYALPAGWKLDFSGGKSFDLSTDVKAPVPDGYHSTTDPAETGGRSFIIVPQEYAFSRNPMEAKTGISGVQGQINLPETYKPGEMLYRMIDKLPQNVLDEHWVTYLARKTERCAAFIQENFDGSMEWVLYRIALLAANNAYIFTMRVNFADSGVTFPAARIDVRNMVCNWINHIQVSGEKAKPVAKATTEPKTKPKAEPAAKPASKPAVKKAEKPAPKPAAKQASKPAPAPKNTLSGRSGNSNVRYLEVKGKTELDGTEFMCDLDTRPMIIPEGVRRIGGSCFTLAKMESVTLPSTMRILEHHAFSSCPNLKQVLLNEGLEQIDSLVVCECPNLKSIKLPDSIRKIDNNAFIDKVAMNPTSHITVSLSGKLARQLVRNNEYPALPAVVCAGCMIDGKYYSSLEDYVRKADTEERARADEDRKQHERNALRNRIAALEKERDAVTGLLGFMKRKRIQGEIDALKEQLRRL